MKNQIAQTISCITAYFAWTTFGYNLSDGSPFGIIWWLLLAAGSTYMIHRSEEKVKTDFQRVKTWFTTPSKGPKENS
jgi:hypothetical protein